MGKDLKGKDLGTGFSQRTDGRYEARALIRGVKIDIYGTDLKQLRKDFEKAKQDVMNGYNVKAQKITVNEWFEEWFVKYKQPSVKSTSIYSTKSRFYSVFGDCIGNILLKDLRNMDIQTAVNNSVSKGKATSSIRSGMSTLKACLESARNNKLIDINPAHDIIVPWKADTKSLRRFLTRDEQTEFLNAVEGNFYKEMFWFMLLTGVRVGELGGLFWSDIDFNKKRININRSLSCQYEKGVKTQRLTSTKTANSVRSIPFMGEVEEMLLSWQEKQKSLKKSLGDRWRSGEEYGDLVFTTSMGSPLTRYTAEKEINKVVNSINYEREMEARLEDKEFIEFEKLYPHALRHTFCCRCFERGLNPKVVQAIMGHAYYSTTIDIYTHLMEEDLENGAEKFGSLILTQTENEPDANQEIV